MPSLPCDEYYAELKRLVAKKELIEQTGPQSQAAAMSLHYTNLRIDELKRMGYNV